MTNKQNGNIVFGRTGRLLICIGVAFLSLGLLLPVPATYAEGQGEKARALPEHYPDRFDGTGRIDRLTVDQIVIDDTLYRLSPYAEFATPTRKQVLRSSLHVGNRVGYLTNEKHEIISLWLIE
jgi:hypothetical protein